MALESKSVDEVTSELADTYDSLIAPQKIWRNHNNKIYLVLRSFAAGMVGLTDTALALRNRFDPLLCDDLDLYSVAKLVGTEFKKGTGSMLSINILNKSTEARTLLAGTYNYQSASGIIFSFEMICGREFASGESGIINAVSQVKGAFPVSGHRKIELFRSDKAPIDEAFEFSCEDNLKQLGYDDESATDFRSRILNDVTRQDHVKGLELKIRNLPNIFECDLIFNEDTVSQTYDGIALAPKELLITITGIPTDEMAKVVCESVIYDTHQVTPDCVVWYHNDLYINGRRPVYYRFHDYVDFSLTIDYQYNSGKLKPAQIENSIEELFRPYRNVVTRLDIFGEKEAYKVIEKLNLPDVSILNIDILDSSDSEVSYVRIPKTRLPRLTNITFSSTDIGGVV